MFYRQHTNEHRVEYDRTAPVHYNIRPDATREEMVDLLNEIKARVEERLTVQTKETDKE